MVETKTLVENKPRNFEEDLINSNKKNIRNAWKNLLKIKFGDDCIILWKDDKNTQLGFGTDITIQTKSGRRYSIELKTRNNKCYGLGWIMEIFHQVYDKEDKETRNHLYKKEGWIYTCTAEYVLHATLNNNEDGFVEAIFYSLNPFKSENYIKEFEKYEYFWLPTKFNSGNFQLTFNRVIPKEDIKRDAIEFWEWEK